MSKFSDVTTATRLRDVIGSIVRDILGIERPADAYATVQSIDRVTRTATVLFPGETTPITLPMSILQPVGTGGAVRIVGTRNDRRIDSPAGTGAVYVDASTVAATTANLTTVTATTVSGTDATLSNSLRATKTTEPALGATAHAFEVGTPGSTAGQTGIMFGPSRIQAKNGPDAAALELNNAGGAVRVGGYPAVPLRNTSGTRLASNGNVAVPSVTATSPGFLMQAGRAVGTFTNGAATLAMTTAFPNGLLCAVCNSEYNDMVIAINPATCTNGQIGITAFYYWDQPPYRQAVVTGQAYNVDYIAIGY